MDRMTPAVVYRERSRWVAFRSRKCPVGSGFVFTRRTPRHAERKPHWEQDNPYLEIPAPWRAFNCIGDPQWGQ